MTSPQEVKKGEKLSAFLICEDGPASGSIISFVDGDEWVLGRDPNDCFFVIEDPMVSRRHGVIRHQDGLYMIENLSEINPLLLNDAPIEGLIELQEDDTLQIGNSYFLFTLEDPHEKKEEEKLHRVNHSEARNSEKLAPSLLSKLPFISPSQNRFVIKVISGPNQGAEFGMGLGESHVIGKDPSSSDIVFQDLSVSRQHARISINEKGELFIEDLESRNGILVNGSRVEKSSPLTAQDLVSVGTTSFLVLDREGSQETIFSPPSASRLERDLERIGHPMDADNPIIDQAKLEEEANQPRTWKETFIPTRHLFVASLFSFVIFVGVISLLALFRSQTVIVDVRDETKEIKHLVDNFKNVQFSYNPGQGKIFLIGHVLTDLDHAELVYLLKSLSFINTIEDNVVVDEGVWQSMNALLIKNPSWRGVMISSTSAGRFVLRGYVDSEDEAAKLQEYVNLNFPYLNLLDNQVVAQTTLETQVQNFLIEQGYVNVSFQFAGGDLLLAGRVNAREESGFNHLVEKHISQIPGVRQVRNFVIFVSESTARIDLSNKYKVMGTSKFGEMNNYVLINGKILSTGDLLDGMSITAITSNEVELDQNGIKYKIAYNQQ